MPPESASIMWGISVRFKQVDKQNWTYSVAGPSGWWEMNPNPRSLDAVVHCCINMLGDMQLNHTSQSNRKVGVYLRGHCTICPLLGESPEYGRGVVNNVLKQYGVKVK